MYSNATARPQAASLMIIAGITLVATAGVTLAIVSRWIPIEYVVLATAPTGLTIGSMLIYGSSMVFRTTRVEDEVLAIDAQLSGQLVEDPDKVTHIQRRH